MVWYSWLIWLVKQLFQKQQGSTRWFAQIRGVFHFLFPHVETYMNNCSKMFLDHQKLLISFWMAGGSFKIIGRFSGFLWGLGFHFKELAFQCRYWQSSGLLRYGFPDWLKQKNQAFPWFQQIHPTKPPLLRCHKHCTTARSTTWKVTNPHIQTKIIHVLGRNCSQKHLSFGRKGWISACGRTFSEVGGILDSLNPCDWQDGFDFFRPCHVRCFVRSWLAPATKVT